MTDKLARAGFNLPWPEYPQAFPQDRTLRLIDVAEALARIRNCRAVAPMLHPRCSDARAVSGPIRKRAAFLCLVRFHRWYDHTSLQRTSRSRPKSRPSCIPCSRAALQRVDTKPNSTDPVEERPPKRSNTIPKPKIHIPHPHSCPNLTHPLLGEIHNHITKHSYHAHNGCKSLY